jgi:hypothetical protein
MNQNYSRRQYKSRLDAKIRLKRNEITTQLPIDITINHQDCVYTIPLKSLSKSPSRTNKNLGEFALRRLGFLHCSVHRKFSTKISFIPELACATGPPSSGLGHAAPLGHLPSWAAPRHCALRALTQPRCTPMLPRALTLATPATLRAPRALCSLVRSR